MYKTRPKFEELVAKLHDVLDGETGYAKDCEELKLLQGQEDSGPSNVNNSITLEVLDEHL
jgi:hypothetical protein